MHLFLFDVDGVLVDPVAYRVGSSRSMEILCQSIGLDNWKDLAINANEIAFFESRGIHDVWDIANIAMAAVVQVLACEQFSSSDPNPQWQTGEVANDILSFRASQPLCPRPNYESFVRHLEISGTQHPPDIAYAYLSSELSSALGANVSPKWIELIGSFLPGSRSVYNSQVTRLFQNIILGSEEFQSTYGLPSRYDGESLLRTADVVHMKASSVSKLKQLVNEHSRVGIYTARPSHPPPDAKSQKGFPGEAEIAREQAKMADFPLVGMGMMEWLAAQHDERAEHLTKPNTTQAVAAILATLAQHSDSSVLEEAYKIDKENLSPCETSLAQLKNKDTTIVVFEDTVSGISPMLNVVYRLQQHGYNLIVKPLGVAKEASKKEALAKLCEKVFPDINKALDFALSQLP